MNKQITYNIIFYCLIFLLSSCKKKEVNTNFSEGFVIEGKIASLPAESMAILTYQQHDESIADTCVVKNGKFVFKEKTVHPSEATITMRHGQSFPEENWKTDRFNFFIDNSAIKISSVDSIKNANMQGSILTDQSISITKDVRPLTDRIIFLQNKMSNKSMEEKIIIYDSIKVYVDSIKKVAHKFIIEHPNSYVALKRFLRHELPKNFDPEVAEKDFNKFNEMLKKTPTGKVIANRIAIAKKTSVGKKALDFDQTDIKGNPFTLSSVKGKYVLLDFWASWCKPCRAENPYVIQAYHKFKEKNFEIVAVSLDASHEAWKLAIEEDGLPWIHVSDLKGWKNEVAVKYDVQSVPTNYLINPEGVIIGKNLRGNNLTNKLDEIFKRDD
ncbi:alkyl hydroperoxide reductase subunit AhpC [Tenacibaculum adriaticum]|uniref:Alkyl hydroperoxide reductase subunit AhpC n=1 Tax=Tenacibaculum adriaticum TaxID=413713 RepID=A0A5S5DNB2_9FLAO|nr:TlpA disulfide reductase family protein [Tenacibaculum adriaticum]TYP97433.1 alkyl hydroperoxide reductase subunit AhpC [Tenacibaculum adriaticum]